MNTSPCPCCESHKTTAFFSVPEQPVFIGVQWPSRDAAISCERGDIDLMFCKECGFIWNRAFDERLLKYGATYNNALDCSAVFRDFEESLVMRLIQTYDVHGKDVIDIGCGKGHFLTRLCEAGNNRGMGFDPSYDGPPVIGTGTTQVIFHRELYTGAFTEVGADLLCCRQVLEHIPSPAAFLDSIREAAAIRRGSTVYFEVPNTVAHLRKHSPWELIYEHVGYYTTESLGHLFHRAGFKILSLHEAFHGMFLGIDVRPCIGTRGLHQSHLSEFSALVDSFDLRYQSVVARWRELLEGSNMAGKKTVAWGAGAKAVGFLNMVDIREAIPYVVDINPCKHGLYLAGTGQRIVSPEFLSEYQPDSVLLMNPIYRSEIANQLTSLGVKAELIDAF